MNKEEELEVKADELYRTIGKFIKDLSIREKAEFFEKLNELIDVEIEIEKFCNN